MKTNSDAKRETHERWARELTSRAVAYWTPERTRGLFGDKELLLPPDRSAPLLRVLGLLKGDASMSPGSVRKYMQISHMVSLLEPMLVELSNEYPLVRILDAGCGSSHLTLLLAWCFRHRWHRPAQIMGVDRNRAVIERCKERAMMTLVEDVLCFQDTSIAELDLPDAWSRCFGEWPEEHPLNVLVALHACDTATDDALALGVNLGVDVIAAAPCCQAELARKWAAIAEKGDVGPFAPVWSSPHLRREAASTLTDALRTLILRGWGYVVTPMEFVPSKHTPKNTLIRAVRRGDPDPCVLEEYEALRDAVGGCDIRLADLLFGGEEGP